MNETRPTAAVWLLLDGDQIAMGLARTIHKGITSNQIVGDTKVDMGARRKWRQSQLVGSPKFEQTDVLCLARDARDRCLDHGEMASSRFTPSLGFDGGAARGWEEGTGV